MFKSEHEAAFFSKKAFLLYQFADRAKNNDFLTANMFFPGSRKVLLQK
jgi:hypothetical protein